MPGIATNSCLCSAPARSLVRTEHLTDRNVLALQRSEAIVWHLRARVGWWVLPQPRPSSPPPRPELSITPPHRSHHGPVPDPLLLPPGHGHVRSVAARGARETTKLLAVKARLKCTKCGGGIPICSRTGRSGAQVLTRTYLKIV